MLAGHLAALSLFSESSIRSLWASPSFSVAPFSALMVLLLSACLHVHLSASVILLVLTPLPSPSKSPFYQFCYISKSGHGPQRCLLTALYFIRRSVENVPLEVGFKNKPLLCQQEIPSPYPWTVEMSNTQFICHSRSCILIKKNSSHG